MKRNTNISSFVERGRAMDRRLFVICAMVWLSGCAGNYGQFYHPYSSAKYARNTGEVQVFKYNGETLQQMERNGFELIGISAFEGPYSKDSAIAHARDIGADCILQDVRDAGSTTTMIPLPSYTPSKDFESNESGTIRTPSGNTYNYEGRTTVTVPGTTTYVPVPITTYRYDQKILYFRKR
jgi:hypothetical protein